jgi:hypothetical protein
VREVIYQVLLYWFDQMLMGKPFQIRVHESARSAARRVFIQYLLSGGGGQLYIGQRRRVVARQRSVLLLGLSLMASFAHAG